MKLKTLLLLIPVVAMAACDPEATTPTSPDAPDIAPQLSKTARGGRAGSLGVVYVSSQGLYYDTFVSASVLPMRGPFQLLENGVTEFGPGDRGYVGGRWWIDANGDGYQNEGDVFLLCPLLGPGRTSP
jgi:hypothetical protein